MRLPTGYGSVHKLPGKRRNPWRARITAGWTDDGKQLYKNLGYYPTQTEALNALANYRQNPYCLDENITFAEVYDRWSARKFEEISGSNINGYKASYKLCGQLYNMSFREIKLPHLQGVVDTCGKNPPTIKKLKSLFSQLFDYAVMNDIINQNGHIVEYLKIPKEKKSTLHYRFTQQEIDTLWRWSENNDYVQVILMLIYSGVRPGELFNVKRQQVFIKDKYFHICRGKNDNAPRKVPIHDRTLPFFEHWLQKQNTEYFITQHNGSGFKFDTNHGQYTESYWVPLLSEMGILVYTNDVGETKEHTPDDTRHTFTTMWKEKRLDEAMRRKIQGHSGKGIGEIVYTHFELERLREELNRL